MKLYDTKIINVNELKYFKNLKYFNFLRNYVIDFPDLTANSQLEVFHFSVNKDSIVNIQAMQKLKSCNLLFKTRIKKLQINNNAKLNKLILSTEFNTPMYAIDSIDVSYNSLDTLISNRIPSSIENSYFNCNNNRIVNIKFSSFDLIQHVDYSNNLLKSSEKITFSGKSIDISNNQFDKFDLIGANKLTGLNFNNNPLNSFSLSVGSSGTTGSFYLDKINFSESKDLKSIYIYINPGGKIGSLNITDFKKLNSVTLFIESDSTIILKELPIISVIWIGTSSRVLFEKVNSKPIISPSYSNYLEVKNKITVKNCLSGTADFKNISCYELEIVENPELVSLGINNPFSSTGGNFEFSLRVINNSKLKDIFY
ncbi:MAG: hypothetical protein IPO92_04700 [Saprospiraceae bacterium]|nr:hypothetical protein [Saprospiraceae bacterium]